VTGDGLHTLLPVVDDSRRSPCVYTSEPDGDERAGGKAMTSGVKGRVRRPAGLSTLIGVLLIAVPAMASDADLQKRVEDRLGRAGIEERGDVQVSVRDGVVTLEGFTLTVDARRDAERAAGKESKRVESRLVVRPSEPVPDAQLEKRVADAILSEPRYGVFDSVGSGWRTASWCPGSVRQPWLKDLRPPGRRGRRRA
jgi:hypothetical protein